MDVIDERTKLERLARALSNDAGVRRLIIENTSHEPLKAEISKLSPQAQQFLVALAVEYANCGTSFDFAVGIEALSIAVEVC